MGTTVRHAGRSRAELEEQAELDRQIDEIARDNWDDAAWRDQMHRDMVETIWYGFMHENLLPYFTTVENAGEFERITVEIVEGLEVFWVAQGAYIDESVLTSKVWPLEPNFVGYHVSENEDEIRSGFAKYQRQLVPQAVNQMDAAVNSRLLRMVLAMLNSGSGFYGQGNGIDLDLIRTFVEEVEDDASGWPETIDTMPAIIGRPTMITGLMNAIRDDNTFAPQQNDELARLGYVGVWNGCNIIKLRNWRDRNKVSYFPGNELLIASPAATKTGFWDGMKSKEWVEEGGEQWHNWGRRKVGYAAPHPEWARRYHDTGRPA
jgi:hypothetical protein